MLQNHTSLTVIYRPYDLLDTIMPSADKAERFNIACLKKTGSSGDLKPGVNLRIME